MATKKTPAPRKRPRRATVAHAIGALHSRVGYLERRDVDAGREQGLVVSKIRELEGRLARADADVVELLERVKVLETTEKADA